MDEMNYKLDLLTAMNEKLMGNDRMFRMICGTSSNAFLYYDFKTDRFETLGCWDAYFDFSMETQADYDRIVEMVMPQQPRVESTLHCERTKKEAQSVTCQLADCRKWLEFEVTVTYDELARPSEKIVRIRDVTKNKEQTDELEYLAYYDTLTGLYNRNYFVRLLSDWVRKAQEEDSCIEIMYIKINQFRKMNDSLGMVAGDELLQNFGLILKQFQGEDVIVSRFSEDSYCMAFYDSGVGHGAEFHFDKITAYLDKPFVLTGSRDVKITIRCGVSLFPESAGNSLELINLAEIVLSECKDKNRNSLQYFDAPILADFLENVQMENRLKDAVEAKKFELYYQPQFDALTNRLRGVEALIRWRSHEGKFISPSVFIPLAERDGYIVQIGNWVMEEAIRTLARWTEKYNTDLIMSINISAIQYQKHDFVQNLMALVDKYKVRMEQIELEITETVFISDQKGVIDKLNRLKEYGFRISLDDFGTGYSSLSYLKGLPIDTLKIDKSFIDTVTSDTATKVITESIIAMVKKLGCETVAEGVETPEQLQYLQAVSCDNIQGFLLGKPMPPDEIERLLGKTS